MLASHFEGMPLALGKVWFVEAGVCTRAGDLAELIGHETTGMLVNTDNVTQLVDSMHCLTSDAERPGALGAAASLRAVERFSLGSMKASYEWIYQNAIAE